MLGIWTRGGNMVGIDKTTELWRQPNFAIFVKVVGLSVLLDTCESNIEMQSLKLQILNDNL